MFGSQWKQWCVDGKIIALEGCDGCGKDTQLDLLYKRLTEDGFRCLKLSFPNYENYTGKLLGELLSKSNPHNLTTMDPRTQAMYFMANRRETFHSLPDLRSNYDFILMGRSVLSNVAYHTNIKDGHICHQPMKEIKEVFDLFELEKAFGNPIYDIALIYDIDYENVKQNLTNAKKPYLKEGDEDAFESDDDKLKYAIKIYHELPNVFSNIYRVPVLDHKGSMINKLSILEYTYDIIMSLI